MVLSPSHAAHTHTLLSPSPAACTHIQARPQPRTLLTGGAHTHVTRSLTSVTTSGTHALYHLSLTSGTYTHVTLSSLPHQRHTRACCSLLPPSPAAPTHMLLSPLSLTSGTYTHVTLSLTRDLPSISCWKSCSDLAFFIAAEISVYHILRSW